MSILKTLRMLALSTALTAATAFSAAQADEQYFPLQSYRVGPYAAGGTGFFGGFIDYMNLINTRDGGVNGVKLVWDECETQYEVERGVECYERLKTRPNVAAWNPLSVGIAYAMIDRITADKVPLITVNHGPKRFRPEPAGLEWPHRLHRRQAPGAPEGARREE